MLLKQVNQGNSHPPQEHGTGLRGSAKHFPPHNRFKRKDPLPFCCPLPGPRDREQTREKLNTNHLLVTVLNTAPRSVKLVVHTQKRKKLMRELRVRRQPIRQDQPMSRTTTPDQTA